MSETLSTVARNAACAAVAALVDGGPAAGRVVLRTAGDVAVATIPMSDPAFGAPVAGVATANAMTADSSPVGGTVAKFTLEDSTGAVVVSGAVGTSAGPTIEIVLPSLVVTPGVPVALTSLTLTMPAS